MISFIGRGFLRHFPAPCRIFFSAIDLSFFMGVKFLVGAGGGEEQGTSERAKN